MAKIPIDLVGGAYESRSIPLNAQVTRNFYPEPVPQGASPSALLMWPGEKLFASGSGANRGMYRKAWKGYVYFVNGTSLFKIDSAGSTTNIGSIPGASRCILEPSLNYMYIVTGGVVYRTDGSTVSDVTDSDLETPNSIAFLNSQMLYDGDQGRFWISAAGDGADVNGLNFASAESSPDDLIRVYTYRQQAVMFGSDSYEPWYNSGVGTPPMTRIENGLRPVGISGVHAVGETDKALYFLGHDRTVYRIEGYEPIPVSTIAISNAIESYSDVSDCEAYGLKLQGQNIVIFQFPTANKTWAYSETFNEWFELSTGVNGDKHLISGYCYAFGKHLVTDRTTGNVYEWDLETFDSNGAPLIRERVTRPFYSELITQAGQKLIWNEIELILNSGNGLVTGQGENPQVMMQYSDDLGLTWSTELWRSAGRLGAYKWRVRWTSLGASINRIYRFRISDPVETHLFKCTAEIEATEYA